jgi:hypothetical protein
VQLEIRGRTKGDSTRILRELDGIDGVELVATEPVGD